MNLSRKQQKENNLWKSQAICGCWTLFRSVSGNNNKYIIANRMQYDSSFRFWIGFFEIVFSFYNCRTSIALIYMKVNALQTLHQPHRIQLKVKERTESVLVQMLSKMNYQLYEFRKPLQHQIDWPFQLRYTR